MKILIAYIILSIGLGHAHLIPVNNPERLVPDELFPYQWGLLNQGQTYILEKDDIHNIPLNGIKGKDIGWSPLIGKTFIKRPIIAVLDSGVDLNHPELKGNLWTNDKECGKDPKIDNDGNKLAGDCNGWNFTASIDSNEAKDLTDHDGHGTHIAGIIAAANDGSGMVGVMSNALIMPIKVLEESDKDKEVHSSDAFALGITYAVDNGADVINMSLGWPRALETKKLRDAVLYALGNGVPIIAAAGNNNSSEPLFPCAYDGVICVASSSLNGQFAGNSNFGSHIDTIAPGVGILSLHPILLEPEFSMFPGYEIRSGTSQSTPLVSGMIAALKANNSKITINQIYAKLYQARGSVDKKKYVLGGEATWNALNAEVVTPVVRPVFKKVRHLLFKGDNTNAKLAISFRNYGVASGEISVKIESLSKPISFSDELQSISNLEHGEAKELQFDASILSINSESNITIRVTIYNGDKSESFINEIPVVRDIKSHSKFKKSDFVFADKPLPMAGVRNGVLVPNILTVEAYGNSSKHEFYMRKILKEEKRIELTVFTKQSDKYLQLSNQIVLNNTLSLVNFIRADLNFDGKEDYLVHTLGETDGRKFLVFSFYNEELKTLWPEFQNVKVNLDLYIESMNDISLIRLDHPILGKILVPAFFTTGALPKADQSISSWDKYDQTRKKRLYYLEPYQTEFRIRSLVTNNWESAIKTELKTKWFEIVDTEQLLPLSKQDAENGQLRILVSVGLSTKRQIFIHTFDSKSNSHGQKLPQLVLQSDSIDPLFSITSKGIENAGDVFMNIYDRTRAKMVTTRGESQVGEYIFHHESETDLIAGHLVSFDQSGQRFTVFQSREEVISISKGSNEKRSSRAKLRYSFLSQKILSEMYIPVTYKRNGSLHPALFVDGTAVTGNRVYLFEEQNGELVASIKNSVVVPTNCKSLQPNFSSSSGTHEFIFLCLEDKEFVIRSLEMN